MSIDTLPIVEVTVLEDRARVKRRGTIQVTEGPIQLALDGIAPLVVDRTLTGSFRESAEGVSAPIHMLRIQRTRRYETSALPAELAEITARIEALNVEKADLEASLGELVSHRTSLAAIGERSVTDTMVDASFGLGSVDVWRERFARVDGRRAAYREGIVRMRRQLVPIQEELNRLTHLLHSKQTAHAKDVATLHVAFTAARDGEVTIEIEYVVANACWRPMHRAELTGDALAFHTDACVWQHTGEAWQGITLVLSTERSQADASPPLLSTDVLTARPRAKTVHVAVRQQSIATTGEGTSSDEDGLPGVDDGGIARVFRASGKVSVKSDGLLHRHRVMSFQTRAESSLQATPELIAAVLRRSMQRNDSPMPILAGPVELVREGGLMGRTATTYVAQGETFELSWGPASALRVQRDEEVRPGEAGFMSSSRVSIIERTLRLSNLSPEAQMFELRERILVSEIEKVKVSIDTKASSPGFTMDADGIVTFPVRLAPRGRAKLKLVFEVRASSDVVGLPY